MIYGPDDCGSLNRRFYQSPSPSSFIHKNSEDDDFNSDENSVDSGPSQSDGLLISLMASGDAPECAVPAAEEILALYDDIPVDESHVGVRVARGAQPAGDVVSYVAGLTLESLKFAATSLTSLSSPTALVNHPAQAKRVEAAASPPEMNGTDGHAQQEISLSAILGPLQDRMRYISPYEDIENCPLKELNDRELNDRGLTLPSILAHLGPITRFSETATATATASSSTETPSPDQSDPTPPGIPQDIDRMSVDSIFNPLTGGFQCSYPGCRAQPFQTQYLLNSHANIHSSNRPSYFLMKGDLIRHGLAHDRPSFFCPYCQNRFTRKDNLHSHVRFLHADKDKDDPLLKEVLSQRRRDEFIGRRQRAGRQYGGVIQTATNDEHDGHSQIKKANLEPSLDLNSPLEGSLELDSLLEGEVPEPLSNLRLEYGMACHGNTFSSGSRTPPMYEASQCRFLTWVAYTRNLSSKISTTEQRTCPLIGCEVQFDSPEFMMLHVPLCPHLSKGVYRCFESGRAEKIGKCNTKGCQELRGRIVAAVNSSVKSMRRYLSVRRSKSPQFPEHDLPKNVGPQENCDVDSKWPTAELSFFGRLGTPEPQDISFTKPMERPSTYSRVTNGVCQLLRRETKGFKSTCTDDENNEQRHVEQHFIRTSNDVPFTDSGYSSLRYNLNPCSNILSSPEKPQCPASNEQSMSMNDLDRDGARTSYSVATSIDPVRAQDYIVELCTDIYGKLRQHFDSKLWNTLARALPVLIKAFAIKIGHESSAQVSQEIMYFLHKRHYQVFTQLEAMFQREDDFILDIPRAVRNGMSLNEKMSMWDRKAGEDQSVTEADDLYQGVKDDEDEITDRVDLPVYHKVILDSAAYEWFLGSLMKEITLQWSATHPRIMVESIRQRILDQLPTRTISKRRSLSGHEVKFGLQWGDTFKGWREYKNFDQLMRSEKSFAELITVTGSVEEAQALTIKQYLSQTWPTSGPQLLNVLQNTINSPYHHYSIMLLDNTQLEARISSSHLTITATGPAIFIAECGEQLAWLQAALSSRSRDYACYCTPSITSYRVNHSRSEQIDFEGYCEIGLDIVHQVNPGKFMPRVQNCWQDLSGINMIIAGFPISRRQENYPGLELSLSTFLNLLKADKITIVDGLVLLKGRSKTVQLMKHSDNVFLWHPLHSEDQGCSCCTNHHVGLNAVVYHSPIDLQILNAGRHFFCDCADLQIAVGKSQNTDHLFELPKLSKPIYAQNRASAEINPFDSLYSGHSQPGIGQSESLTVFPEYQNDMADLNESIFSITDCFVSADDISRFQKNYQDVDSFLGDTNLITADSHPIVAMGSVDDSLESYFLSMSDFSEQIEPVDNSEPEHPLLNTLLQELLSGFRSTTQCQLSPGEYGEVSAAEPITTASSNTTCNPIQCRKRNRQLEDDEEASQDGFRKPPRKRINPGEGKALQRTFACPYLKLDPITHRKCCKYQLSRIRDVKQHLHRHHTPELYCQRCFKTDFLDQQSLQSHVNLGDCPIEDPTILKGISNHQQKQLSRKSNRKLSEEDKWFEIWWILFPGVQRPLSAYIDTSVSEDMRLFREYSLTRGPDVLRGQIESNPAWSGADVTAEQRQILLNRVIVQGIDSLFDDYLRSITSADSIGDRRASSSGRLSHNLHPARLATPTSSNADSGVALESQLSSSVTVSQRDLLYQPPGIVELNYQMAADNRAQDNPTMQELVAEPTQSQETNSLDPALDHCFDNQFFGAGWLTFDQAPDFDTGTNLDL